MKYGSSRESAADGAERRTKTPITVDGRKKRSLSFRSKIALLMAGTSLFALLLVGAVMLNVSAARVAEMSREEHRMMTERAVLQLDFWFARWQTLIESEATRLSLGKHFDVAENTEFFEKLLASAHRDASIVRMYFISTVGGMIFRDQRFDENGRSFIDFFGRVALSDGTLFSRARPDLEHGRSIVTIARAVRDGYSTRGIVAIDVYADHLLAALTSHRQPAGSYSFIVDADMNVVAHPDDALFYLVDGRPMKIDDPTSPDYSPLRELIDSAGDGDASVEIDDYDGQKRSFYAHRSEISSWHVITALSSQEIDDSRRDFTKTFVMIGAAAIVFTLACGYLAATAITYMLNSILLRALDDEERERSERG